MLVTAGEHAVAGCCDEVASRGFSHMLQMEAPGTLMNVPIAHTGPEEGGGAGGCGGGKWCG